MKRGGVIGSEAYVREQLDSAQKELKALKLRNDALQNENHALKKSVFELSTSLNTKGNHKYFDINSILHFESSNQRIRVEDDHQRIDQINPNSSREKIKDGRHFYYRNNLEGHSGPIHTIQFSPNGRLLASGSFDKTIRLWDIRGQKESKRLEKHTLNVSDICWSNDSTQLVSGSFDQSCNLWEVENGFISSFKVDGFVQSVSISPQDESIFVCGTTRKHIYVFDKRKSGESFIFKNDSMINSLYVSKDGMNIITGDSNGNIKVWDLRTGENVSILQNESTGKPISHLQMWTSFISFVVFFPSKNIKLNLDQEMELNFLAVNSFDNVLRIYEWKPTNNNLRLIHSLKGHINQNWPIRSSFFQGKDYHASMRDLLQENNEKNPSGESLNDIHQDPSNISIDQTMLIATGSADTNAYVFDISRDKSNELIQKLEGHTDKVYAVNFHPFEPILASCSSDFTIKIWNANRKK